MASDCAGSSQKVARICIASTADVHDVINKGVCESCGHELGAQECCTNESVTKKTRITMGSGRAGERQKQAEARRLKEQARLQEAASLRPREILTTSAAVTTAQKSLARLREWVNAKKDV